MPEDISSSKAKEENSKLPSHARVVVIGGGVVGCSILYHLTLHGWKDVVLLEKMNLHQGQRGMLQGIVQILLALGR